MDLSDAVGEGDLETIRALLDAGADIRYVRPHGYTVMIDVMYGRSSLDDPQLLSVLRLLIERGADLDAVSDHGESALSVVSLIGRFDAVGMVLDAGANPAPLEWSSLHRAVALGTIYAVRHRIEQGDDLGARDRWERTPWLLSLQTRDLAKAEVLLEAGADLSDRGRCGKTPLMYAVENEDSAMLRWLLERGIDPNGTDEFGGTPLAMAAGLGAAECVRLLLDAGADINLGGEVHSPMKAASSLEVTRILVAAGADPADMNDSVKVELTRLPRTGGIDCSPDDYRAAKHRVFGTANPERMNFPFWQAMVRWGSSAYGARKHFEGGRTDGEPVWCFDRFGKSLTELPDRQIIEIAGEHEDFYDSDFCIYNDVIVHHGDGTFDIYGYPKDVFPPTDFHTATLVGGSIYLIGNLGYSGERRYGTTQVYRLDVETLRIERVTTAGEAPGWISGHRAKLVGNGIEVSGGKVCEWVDGKETYEDNQGKHVLDLETLAWRKIE
jgi:ankyrin repeat protein